MIAGWALVYWPRLPESFSYGPGSPVLDPTALDAVYLSSVTLATLGYGDIVPISPWLRLAMPLESLLGFGLLTAAVSWVLQVYPALTRRRSLALRLATLERTRTVDSLDRMHPTTAASLLDGITDAICATHLDYVQYTETYYFGDPSPETSLGATVGYARHLAQAAQACGSVDARQAGASLTSAVDELARVLDEQYLRTGADVEGVLVAFRHDQH